MGCGESKKPQEIVLAPAAVPAAAPAPQQRAAGGKGGGGAKKGRPPWAGKHFQVKLAGDWKDYEREEDQILTRAYLVGQPNCRFTLRGSRYEYNFKRMNQKNLDTGKERDIRAPPGMRPPKAPLLPVGPMVVITVKKGQPGTLITIDDPNNKGQKLQVAIPPKAKPGAKIAVPIPNKSESLQDVQKKQQGHSTGAKVAMGTAAVAGVGVAAVGGIILGDYLTGGDLGAADMAEDAGEAVADHAVEGAEAVAEWDGWGDAADAGADAADAVGEWEGWDDAADWLGDAAEDVGDFVMDMF